MLLRGRPRTLGAAALLLLLLIGFFLFGGDPDCELGGKREARRGGGGGGDPGSVPGSPTPRVPPDGRPRSRGAATFDGDPPADPRGHNRSDCIPPLPPPPKCEVGRCARPLAVGIPGSPPRPQAQGPGHLWESQHLVSALTLTSQPGAPRVHTCPSPGLGLPVWEMRGCTLAPWSPLSTLQPSSDARWGSTALGRVNPTPGPSRLEPADLLSPPQLLQVAIVCAGHNSSRDVITLVKSLLFYRYSQECPFPPWKEAVRIP